MADTSRPLKADFKNVQAHYDLGDDFFALFLDPSMTYSCAKFDTPETTLADAQIAKIDLSLGKCDLKPGQKLLDIGCGWGATARRAREKYGVEVVGLTLSENQLRRCRELAEGKSGLEFRLEGWETFNEKVDRIVSIGAFEHFGRANYSAFFQRTRSLLPEDGVMLLHTITEGKPLDSWESMIFARFINVTIFPGGDLPTPDKVIEMARTHGFEVVHVESLRPHYARTLEAWAANLESRREEAIRVASEKTYDVYMKYLTGCAKGFHSGECNIYQFKMRPA